MEREKISENAKEGGRSTPEVPEVDINAGRAFGSFRLAREERVQFLMEAGWRAVWVQCGESVPKVGESRDGDCVFGHCSVFRGMSHGDEDRSI